MISRREDTVFFRGFGAEVVLRLAAYVRKMLQNPRWMLMSVAGRFKPFRSWAVSASESVSAQKSQYSNFSNLDVDKVVECLRKDGYCPDIYLPSSLFNEIVDFAHTTPCYGNLNPSHGFLYSDRENYEKKIGTLFSAQYFNTMKLCPAIQTLASDPQLLHIASRYLGTEPVCTGSRLWWTFVVNDKVPYDSSKTITFFHYDLDDYACFRFFFYLTDVERGGGAHVVVRGSHENKSFSHIIWPIKRRSDEKIMRYYDSKNIVKVTGREGFGFAEDTFCYHKATRPLHRNRLMLQVQFASRDYGLHNDTIDPSLLLQL